MAQSQICLEDGEANGLSEHYLHSLKDEFMHGKFRLERAGAGTYKVFVNGVQLGWLRTYGCQCQHHIGFNLEGFYRNDVPWIDGSEVITNLSDALDLLYKEAFKVHRQLTTIFA